MVDFLIRDTFIHICEFCFLGFSVNVVVVFIDVCLCFLIYALVSVFRWATRVWYTCAMWMWVWGWFVVGSWVSFATWSTVSLLIIPICAMTSCIVTLRADHIIWLTMVEMINCQGGCVGRVSVLCDCWWGICNWGC